MNHKGAGGGAAGRRCAGERADRMLPLPSHRHAAAAAIDAVDADVAAADPAVDVCDSASDSAAAVATAAAVASAAAARYISAAFIIISIHSSLWHTHILKHIFLPLCLILVTFSA